MHDPSSSCMRFQYHCNVAKMKLQQWLWTRLSAEIGSNCIYFDKLNIAVVCIGDPSVVQEQHWATTTWNSKSRIVPQWRCPSHRDEMSEQTVLFSVKLEFSSFPFIVVIYHWSLHLTLCPSSCWTLVPIGSFFSDCTLLHIGYWFTVSCDHIGYPFLLDAWCISRNVVLLGWLPNTWTALQTTVLRSPILCGHHCQVLKLAFHKFAVNDVINHFGTKYCIPVDSNTNIKCYTGWDCHLQAMKFHSERLPIHQTLIIVFIVTTTTVPLISGHTTPSKFCSTFQIGRQAARPGAWIFWTFARALLVSSVKKLCWMFICVQVVMAYQEYAMNHIIGCLHLKRFTPQ